MKCHSRKQYIKVDIIRYKRIAVMNRSGIYIQMSLIGIFSRRKTYNYKDTSKW